MITPAATNPTITQQGYKMVFRTIGTDDQQGPTAGRYIATQIKPKKLAIIHDSQTYGKGIAEEVRKTVEAAGIKPVLFEGINKGQTDFSALITKMKKNWVCCCGNRRIRALTPNTWGRKASATRTSARLPDRPQKACW